MNPIEKFQALLEEVFQFETADLDFGVYRILNYKRDQIRRFIREDLNNKVDGAFAKHKDERLANIGQRLDEAREKVLQALGADAVSPTGVLKEGFRDTPVGREYLSVKAQKDEAEAIDEIRLQVFNDLYSFFSRYYQEGDFVPQYRYSIRNHRYAIPYSGEEVMLYWANRDQYYTKTGVLFRDYAFFTDATKAYKVVFRTVAAKEEVGSNKATKARFFVLDSETPLKMPDPETLIIRFQYRELSPDEARGLGVEAGSNTGRQEKINAALCDTLLKAITDVALKGFLLAGYKNDKGLLSYQLARFTAKNTKDYFIHKDLKGFLADQLDYFIKAEVISLETLERERFFDKHITRAKVVREIGGDIIDFLAQIEDFQKRLWEKKKFVVKTEYVITTDLVPADLYPEILKNKAQQAEWKDLGLEPARAVEDLKARKLPLDTKHFGEGFKEKLLEALTEKADLDDLLDGLAIKSENWQGLNLLAEKYREKVKCIYIDPPYNTGEDGFLYRDTFQYSSWLSMMSSRIALSGDQMSREAVFLCSIDDYELNRLTLLIRQVFGDAAWQATFIRKRRSSSALAQSLISQDHEYVIVCSKPEFRTAKGIEKQYSGYSNPDNDPRGDWTLGDLTVGMDKSMRPNQFYDLISPHTGKTFPANPNRVWAFIPDSMNEKIKEGRVVFPDDPKLLSIGISLSSPMVKRYKVDLKQDVNPVSTLIGLGKGKRIDDELVHLFAGLNTEATKEMLSIFGSALFLYAKPSSLVTVLVEQFTPGRTGEVLDFFAGSGTTAHAVINLNREDGGRRKYILIEMANYFETVLIPRIKKVVYADKWKDGKPQNEKGVSHFMKYQYLEQYEDSLDNIVLTPNRAAEGLFGDDYLLRYFIDFETREGTTLLNVEALTKPFSYRLKVNSEEVGEPKEVVVDVPETFTYLLGLKVRKVKVRTHKGTKYHFTLGEREGMDVAVVWREYDDAWTDGRFTDDKAFITAELDPWAPRVVYINGQSVLTPQMGEHVVVEIRQIEPDFKALMGG